MTACKSCGALMVDNALKCPGCGAAQTKTGILGTLWRLLFQSKKLGGLSLPSFKMTITKNARIVLKNSKTGTTKEFHSIEQVPTEYQEKIREALQKTGSGSMNAIRFTDASGKTFTYNSIHEMPPEQRALYEAAMGTRSTSNR
jgi:hypothetical protein